MSMKHAPGTTSQLSPRVASGSPSESPASTPGFFLLLNLRLLRQKDPIVRLKSALLVGLSPVRPAGLSSYLMGKALNSARKFNAIHNQFGPQPLIIAENCCEKWTELTFLQTACSHRWRSSQPWRSFAR